MESQTSSMSPAGAQISLAEERVTGYGWKALAGSGIGFRMDGFDMLILSFMLAAISADLALTSTQAGSLVTWTMLGAVAGGLIFGTMSDHFGRIKVLTWTIVVFAVFTGLCGLACGYWDLVAYRTFASLGLGGEYGITNGACRRGLAGQQARPCFVLCWTRLASGSSSGRVRHPNTAAGDRLARHVPGRRTCAYRKTPSGPSKVPPKPM